MKYIPNAIEQLNKSKLYFSMFILHFKISFYNFWLLQFFGLFIFFFLKLTRNLFEKKSSQRGWIFFLVCVRIVVLTSFVKNLFIFILYEISIFPPPTKYKMVNDWKLFSLKKKNYRVFFLPLLNALIFFLCSLSIRSFR